MLVSAVQWSESVSFWYIIAIIPLIMLFLYYDRWFQYMQLLWSCSSQRKVCFSAGFCHVMEENFLRFLNFYCEIIFLRTLCRDTHGVLIILYLLQWDTSFRKQILSFSFINDHLKFFLSDLVKITIWFFYSWSW